MKLNLGTMITTAVISLSITASSVRANSIYEIGEVDPANPADAGSELTFLQALVSDYNTGTPTSVVIGPHTDVLTLNPGSSVPAPNLPTPLVNDGQNAPSATGLTSLTLTVPAGADYLSVKWGDQLEAYYVGGVDGLSEIFTDDVNRNGASHYDWYDASSGTNVPDSTMTLSLLGGSSVLLAAFRRKFAK